jgi:hypothetical protein
MGRLFATMAVVAEVWFMGSILAVVGFDC